MAKYAKLMIPTLAVIIAFAGCAKSSGNNNSPPPGPPPPGAFGTCDANAATFCGPVGQPGYIGTAEWTGMMTVADPVAYRDFLRDNRLCYGAGCDQVINAFTLAIETITTNLPGMAQFVIHTQRFSGGTRWMSRMAQAAFLAGNDGLQLAYSRYGNNWNTWGGNQQPPVSGQQPIPGQQQIPVQQQSGMLQIQTHFMSPERTEMDAQVYYHGVLIGTGHMVINPAYLQFASQGPVSGQPIDPGYSNGQPYGYGHTYSFDSDSSSGSAYHAEYHSDSHHDHGQPQPVPVNNHFSFGFAGKNGSGFISFGTHNGYY